jgi:uncharacterized protein (DUF1697 family)
MARPRRKVPLDAPWKIAVRERSKPFDFSVLKPKDQDWYAKWYPMWVNKDEKRVSQMKILFNFQPVKVDEMEAPYAYGDSTTKFIHHGDLILMKCPRDEYEQRCKENRLYNETLLQSEFDRNEEVAAGMGVKLKTTLTSKEDIPVDDEEDEA